MSHPLARRLPAALAAVALLGGLVGAVAAPATAAPKRHTLPFDFNGDGRADLAIGVPGETVSKTRWTGGVNVLLGSAHGVRTAGNRFWSRKTKGVKGIAEQSDGFGHELASGDFDADGYADLAITAASDSVHVLYGSRTGLTAHGNQLLRRANLGHELQPEALAVGDFRGDGYDDLAIGSPGQSVGGKFAGSVLVVDGSSSGLRPRSTRQLTEKTKGVPGTPENYDGFGAALAAADTTGDDKADELLVGAPGEDVDTVWEAGALYVFVGHHGPGFADNQVWTQNSPGIADEAGESCEDEYEDFGRALAVGDVDGDGRADVAVSVPGELTETNALGYCLHEGAVHVLRGGEHGLTADGSAIFDRSTPGLAQDDDAQVFGDILAFGDYDGDGKADLAASLGGGPLAMSVSVLPGSALGTTAMGSRLLSRGPGGLPGRPTGEFDDDVVTDLSTVRLAGGRRDALVIGASEYQRGGTTTVVYGSAKGLDLASAQLWSQDTPGVVGKSQLCDEFGTVDAVSYGQFQDCEDDD